MHAALGVGDERSFKVDACGDRSGRCCARLDRSSDSIEGTKRCIDRCGHCGGEIICYAFGRKKCTDGGKGLRRAFHCVVAGGAVDMDVEKHRCERGFTGCDWAGLDGCDDAVIVNGDLGIIDDADGGDESPACNSGSHCGVTGEAAAGAGAGGMPS
jgi:hypothetical protein